MVVATRKEMVERVFALVAEMGLVSAACETG